MMGKELEDLVVDARLLALSAKESESKLDGMLRRANLISGTLTCTREYQRDVEKLLVATGRLDRRRGLLEDLQRENRMIQSYEEENSMLRDQLEKSYATLDEIVARHREIMSRVQSDQTFCHLSPAMLQQICDSEFSCDVTTRNEQIEQAHRLMDVMRYCEVVAQRDTEMFAKIVRENRNLRELLNYAAISDPSIISQFRKSLQAYERDQKARALSRKQRLGEGGDSSEEDQEEDEDTSVLFNRSNLTESTVGNATMRLAAPFKSTVASPAAGGGAATSMLNGLLEECGVGAGGEQQLEEEECVEDILAGIDELSEESDAETVMERDDEACERAIKQDEGEERHENESVAAPEALAAVAGSPPAKKETDADSGTASSLSSSPASSSSSDGDNAQ